MATDNKTLVRQLTEEVWNNGNVDQVDELAATNLVSHDPNFPISNGPQGLKQHVKQIRTAFPDLRETIENTISDGDTVVTRWSCRGTHKGNLLGIGPSGKNCNVTGITIHRLQNNKIVETHTNFDALGLLQQIGVVQQNVLQPKGRTAT